MSLRPALPSVTPSPLILKFGSGDEEEIDHVKAEVSAFVFLVHLTWTTFLFSMTIPAVEEGRGGSFIAKKSALLPGAQYGSGVCNVSSKSNLTSATSSPPLIPSHPSLYPYLSCLRRSSRKH